MSSEVVGGNGLEVLEIIFYIRGYHAYMNNWEPEIQEPLVVKVEVTNVRDSIVVMMDN